VGWAVKYANLLYFLGVLTREVGEAAGMEKSQQLG
jgi:hypothetical protein